LRPKRKIATILLLMALGGSGAFASIVTYNVSGTMADNAVLSGFMTIDNVVGVATAVNFSLGAPDSEAFSVISTDGSIGTGWLIQASLTGSPANSYPSFSMVLPTTTLVGYAGGSLCSQMAPCGNLLSGVVLGQGMPGPQLKNGVASATPEPGTLLMLAMALPALIFLRRSTYACASRRMS
jgi:hypothetical protein